MAQVIAVRDNFNYYIGELKDVWITNETDFNPDNYYYESSPPMSSWMAYATNKQFYIHSNIWNTTMITAVVETLTINNTYHIPVVCINTPGILEYFRKIPTSLMLVNGKPKHRPLIYTSANIASSPRISDVVVTP
jgi:hypothetical protein